MTGFRLPDYLDHIRQAAGAALSYVEGMSEADFVADSKTQHAVIMNLFIIGEAVTKIANSSPEFITGHAEIPWQNMRSMRNRIAHGYFDIDLHIVWNTVAIFLPDLLKNLPSADQ